MHDPKVGDMIFMPEEGKEVKIYEIEDTWVGPRLWVGGKHDCYYWSHCGCLDCQEKRAIEHRRRWNIYQMEKKK